MAQPDARKALSAISELRAQLVYALGGDEAADPVLVRDLIALHTHAVWCRDAGLALAKRAHPWASIAEATGIADATLQSRLETWIKRGHEK